MKLYGDCSSLDLNLKLLVVKCSCKGENWWFTGWRSREVENGEATEMSGESRVVKLCLHPAKTKRKIKRK